ncbi:hypothetical protein PYCC9005_000533 [Savitreella phatthalungensis]
MAAKRGAQQAAKAVSKKQRAEDSNDVKDEKDSSNEGSETGGKDGDVEILKYLADPAMLDEISPEEVLGSGKDKDIRYPHSDLPPFLALVSALLLSKPFSHRLGMRAIYTLFNEPYGFTTPKKIADAGGDERWQALMDAHTLHKEKTSGQLRDLAKYIEENFPEDYDNDKLEQFRKKADKSRDNLMKQACAIKGFAEKTSALFFRRAQLDWPDELFPFADELALEAAREIGLSDKASDSAEGLSTALHEAVGGDQSSREFRRTYINVLEVLIGKKLDKDIDGAKEAISGEAQEEDNAEAGTRNKSEEEDESGDDDRDQEKTEEQEE